MTNELANVKELLTDPGDEASIRVTKSKRLVGRINTQKLKMTQVVYPTGTKVTTKIEKDE